jgi:hypothetical protein
MKRVPPVLFCHFPSIQVVQIVRNLLFGFYGRAGIMKKKECPATDTTAGFPAYRAAVPFAEVQTTVFGVGSPLKLQ